MVDELIVTSVKDYLRELALHGLIVRFAVVFGSQVTGSADHWSDVDLLVVSPRFDGARNREDINLLWRMAALTDSRIEPIPCGERQWLEDGGSPIVEIARKEGQRVSP